MAVGDDGVGDAGGVLGQTESRGLVQVASSGVCAHGMNRAKCKDNSLLFVDLKDPWEYLWKSLSESVSET
jgi:hypothetical protein